MLIKVALVAIVLLTAFVVWRLVPMAVWMRQLSKIEVVRPQKSEPYRVALSAFKDGDRAPLAALLLDPDTDTGNRASQMSALGDEVELDDARAWVAEQPDDPAALTLLADRLIWHAGVASWDGDNEAFVALSEEGEALLERLVQLRPDAPYLWMLRMWAAIALPSGLSAVEQHFAKAAALAPGAWEPHSILLQASLQRSLGSHGAMFAVARRAGANHPKGPLALLIIPAHFERLHYLACFDEDDELADAYPKRPDVRDEINRAFDEAIDHLEPSYDSSLARSSAAAWFYLVDDDARLDRALGDDPVFFEDPWDQVAGEEGFRTACLIVRRRRAAS